ncbi:hypothetical protein [Streptomyces sp. NRRL S-87]|uniref:hypothetical protein n=1 Tax=Streptomyces sp. NRRL S-87 TaxID=1463920 RepID=UPI0007C52803|nr:hypothetical protein [Streptomyces sp. NRRL S-87]
MSGRAFEDFPDDVRRRALQFLGERGTGAFPEASNTGSEGSEGTEGSEGSERSESSENSENSESTERSEYKEHEHGWGADRLPGGPGSGLTWEPR